MKPNRKFKVLVGFIIMLVLIDVVLLVFFILHSPPSKRDLHSHEPNSMAKVLEKEVGFNQSQLDQYAALRSQQRSSGRPLFDSLRKSKENFYKLLWQPQISDSMINSNAEKIAMTQQQLDLQMFHYFQQVRELCTPQQLPLFDSVIKNTVVKMVGGGRGNSKNDKNSPHN
ncbi:MAG: hypothetical protein JSS98_04630 [Bacteroidetes bacterium]|nr:hypothetical protein [Bacteroidota bacterium]